MSIKKLIKNFTSNVFIVAEIGVNHEGSFKRCIELINQANQSGADAIKLQTISPSLNYCKNSESYRLFSKCQLSRTETKEIFRYCKKKKIRIFSTVGDIETLHWISKQSPFAYKVSSGLLNNIPLIKEILKFNKPIFFSIGMASDDDLKNLRFLLQKYDEKKVAILDCISMYPTPIEFLNFSNISNLKKKFKCTIGFSDHSIDENVPLLATIAGAEIIEKHFSFDTSREGFDHKISFDKDQFSKMVGLIRKYEKSLCSDKSRDIKKRQRLIFARCIVANRALDKNQIITHENIIIKRPINAKLRGEEPINFNLLIGKRVNKKIPKDYPIKLKDVS